MLDLSKIDPNFVDIPVDEAGLCYHDCLTSPFRLYGLLPPNQAEPYFHRMPADRAYAVSQKVGILAPRSAGGRIRFQTDSNRVSIRAFYAYAHRNNHSPLTGSAGFDLYDGTHYAGTFRPPCELTDSYCSELKLTGPKALRELTINFPNYSTVSALEIGLEEDALLLPPEDYRISVPVVYYGSSITQGGCASRPGCTYQNIISRRFHCDFWNLGFSGNAKGEPEIAQYLSELTMSAFVLDYDHNAPSPEHLQKTHWPLYHTIRQTHPDIPILMMTRPLWQLRKPGDSKRRDVIMETFLRARAAGDTHVYFVDCSSVFNIFGGDCCTVDGTHPNDMGFFCMAKALGDILELAFREQGMIP